MSRHCQGFRIVPEDGEQERKHALRPRTQTRRKKNEEGVATINCYNRLETRTAGGKVQYCHSQSSYTAV
jgi:hypothetical protein